MKMSGVRIQKSGVTGLDEILSGGFAAGRTYLIEGQPGTGKTTLALQFLMNGRDQGEKGLYITLSETKEELDLVACSHGWDLSGIEVFEPPTDDSLNANPNTFFHTSEVELSQTNKVILEALDKVKPTRVVLDSLSELKLLTLDSIKFRRQVMALKQVFSSRGMTALLLDDKFHSVKEQEIQSIVHGVLSLEQLSPNYGTERRRLRVLKCRGVSFKGGFHDYSLRTGGMVVFPRLAAVPLQPASDGASGSLSSGIKELDELWGGSIDCATSTLFMGPAGSGKSSLAFKYADQAAAGGERVAAFIFDEGKKTLLDRCRGLGVEIEKHLRAGLMTLRQVDPAEISPGEFMMLVRDEVENRGARLVVIDSLNGYMNAMPEERFLVIHMHELLNYLRQMSVSTLLTVAQHGLLGSTMENSVDVSYIADNVLLFRYFEAKGAVQQAISVVKRRSGRHERTIRELGFSNQGIKVGPPLENFQGILTGTPELLLGNRTQNAK